MALRTEKPVQASAKPPVAVNTTVLELAMYKLYTWGGYTYEKGKPYRFKNSDAMILLGEMDTGRPVWKIYRPPPVKQAPKNEIVDATMIAAPTPVDEFGQPLMSSDDPAKRIDVGSDDEIADILNRPDIDESGDVTV